MSSTKAGDEEYPELAKLAQAAQEGGMTEILDFLEWVRFGRRPALQVVGTGDPPAWLSEIQIRNVVYEYFQIDPKLLEAERRKVLAQERAAQEARP